MTIIPDGFLQGNTNLTGTLKVGPAVQTIGDWAFFGSRLTGLDLSEATALASVEDSAFYGSGLAGTLVIPAKLAKIGPSAFQYTKLTHLDLSKAPSLAKIGDGIFRGNGSLVISATRSSND